MKLLLLLILSVFALAFEPSNSTDIQDIKTNLTDLKFTYSDNFECNLYIEKSGEYLFKMSKDEDLHNTSSMSNNYILFLNESNRAIAICKEVSVQTSNELIDIQSNIELYYKLNYK